MIRDAQFSDDTVDGLIFSVAGVGEGRTDASGKFQFAEGRKIDFFIGGTTNRIAIGSATPGYTSGVVAFSLHDLTEAQATNGDVYLSNLLRVLELLDANDDASDGFQLDAAANTAIDAAVAGVKSLDFSASPADFENDAIVKALVTAKNRNLLSADEALARYTLLFRQQRSSSIALTSDDTRAVVVNRQKASVSVIRVRNTDGTDAAQLLAEVPVGKEPRFVALSPNNSRAYVTSAVDGTMSTIDLTAATPAAAGSRRGRRRRAARHRHHAQRQLRFHRRQYHRRRGRGAPVQQRGGRPRENRRQSVRHRHQQRRRPRTTTTSACTSRSSSAKSSTRPVPTASTTPSRAW